jgi:cell division protein FtsB
MREFQQQRHTRAFFASRTVLTILFLLLIGAGVASFRALLDGMEVAAERTDAEEKLQNLETEREALTSELEDLHSGQGIERAAREKLNYRKPGEEVVIILNNEYNEDQDQETDAFLLWGNLKKFFNFRIFNFQ